MRHLLVVVSFAFAASAVADPAPIDLTVTGAIDSNVLATSLAVELGRPVVPARDSCAAPCLDVVVGEGRATIVFTTASATSRTRTIALGDDHAQWNIVITLLAGNLVRDEASDLLGLLPGKPQPPADDRPAGATAEVIAPPAPTPLPPAAEARAVGVGPATGEGPATGTSFAIGLFPIASTDLTDTERRHFLSLDLIAGLHGGISGLALAGIADVERGYVSGAQIAGIAAVADRVTGFQISGIAAVADRTNGAQVAGIAAYADGDAKTQIGGIAAVANGSAALQIGGIAAHADGDGGVQIGGISATASRRSRIQIAGIATYADSAAVQVAGIVNVTDHLAGLQIALINVASRNDGMQLGIINVGGGPDGDSFGLINIVSGGRYDVEGAVDTDRIGTLLLRHGGRHWHNVYGVGGKSITEPAGARNDDVWMYGAGLGPTFRLGGSVLDVEAIAWQVNHGARHDTQLSLLSQLRATLGIPLGPVMLVGGGELNAYISNDPTSPLAIARTTMPEPMTTRVHVTLWPSLFVGLRL